MWQWGNYVLSIASNNDTYNKKPHHKCRSIRKHHTAKSQSHLPSLPLSRLKDEDVQRGQALQLSPRCESHAVPGLSPWTAQVLIGLPPPAQHILSHQASQWSWGHWWQSPPLCCAGSPRTSLWRWTEEGRQGYKVRKQHFGIYNIRRLQIPDTSGRPEINTHPWRPILKYVIHSAVTFASWLLKSVAKQTAYRL